MSGLRIIDLGAVLALTSILVFTPHAAWAVNASNPTPVTVVNPSVPVTVGNPADPAAFAKAQGIQHPFHIAARCSSNISFMACNSIDAVDFSTLFPNQRIIIEYYNISCIFAPGFSLRSVDFIDTNNDIHYSVPILDHVGASNAFSNAVALSQSVRVYLDAGTKVDLAATAVGATASPQGLICNYVFSGQAIDP